MHNGRYSVTRVPVDGRVAMSTRRILNMRYHVKTIFCSIISSPYTFFFTLCVSQSASYCIKYNTSPHSAVLLSAKWRIAWSDPLFFEIHGKEMNNMKCNLQYLASLYCEPFEIFFYMLSGPSTSQPWCCFTKNQCCSVGSTWILISEGKILSISETYLVRASYLS